MSTAPRGRVREEKLDPSDQRSVHGLHTDGARGGGDQSAQCLPLPGRLLPPGASPAEVELLSGSEAAFKSSNIQGC